MTMKDLLEKIKSGNYGFNKEFVVNDKRVQNANGKDISQKVKEAVLDYSIKQLEVVKTMLDYYDGNTLYQVFDDIQYQNLLLQRLEVDVMIAKNAR